MVSKKRSVLKTIVSFSIIRRRFHNETIVFLKNENVNIPRYIFVVLRFKLRIEGIEKLSIKNFGEKLGKHVFSALILFWTLGKRRDDSPPPRTILESSINYI